MGMIRFSILLCMAAVACHRAPITRGVGGNEADVIKLSSDASVVKRLFADTVQVFDKETLLLYKKDAVYQINLPENAVEESESLVNTESPYSLLKSLESTNGMTLKQFTRLSGIEQNAQLVFNDWDSNGDGILDRTELLEEEIKEVDRMDSS